jgi:hypothetical protein
MPRVKRGVTARARHKKIIKLAKGYRGRRNNVYRIAKQARWAIRLPRSPQQEACVPCIVDHAYQRGGASARHDVQRVHQRPEEGFDRTGPQGAGRHGCVRQGCFCCDRSAGESRRCSLIALWAIKLRGSLQRRSGSLGDAATKTGLLTEPLFCWSNQFCID